MATPGSYGSTNVDSYESADFAQNSTWYPLAIVEGLISGLRSLNVATQAGRDAGLDIVASLVKASPYVISSTGLNDIRFGSATNAAGTTPNAHNAFVAAFCDGWDIVFAKLRASLDFRDRMEELSATANAATSEVDQSKSTPDPGIGKKQRNDNNLAISFLLNQMENLIRCKTGVYNYRLFERKYQLTWVNAVPGFADVRPPQDIAHAVAAELERRERLSDPEGSSASRHYATTSFDRKN